MGMSCPINEEEGDCGPLVIHSMLIPYCLRGVYAPAPDPKFVTKVS